MGFPDPSYTRATATFLPDPAQLALMFGDGLGGEGQWEAQQVHFTPEGIYLGGLGKKKEERETNDRNDENRREAGRGMWREEIKPEIICHLRRQQKHLGGIRTKEEEERRHC